MGAAAVVDYTVEDPVESSDAVPRRGRRVIDLVGIPDLLVAVVAVLKPGGRVTSTVLPPEMGRRGLGIEGKTTARYTADHRFPEIAVRIAEGSLRIPAIQAFLFDHIQDAVALQATRHVRGKIAVQIGLIAHAESELEAAVPRSAAGLCTSKVRGPSHHHPDPVPQTRLDEAHDGSDSFPN